MKDLRVELLYTPGCPHVDQAREALDEVLTKLELEDVEVQEVAVETAEAAERLRFPGSPTVRVNGADVYPTRSTEWVLACRRYAGDYGWQGYPPRDFIRETLERFID